PADCPQFPATEVRIRTARPVSDQLGPAPFIVGAVYLSRDCSLHQCNHRPRLCRRRWLRDAAALPLVRGRRSYDRNRLCRSFSSKLRETLGEEDGRMVPRRSRSEGTDILGRGNIIGAPLDSSNSPTGVIAQWRSRPAAGEGRRARTWANSLEGS